MKAHPPVLITAVCAAALALAGTTPARTESPGGAPLMKAVVYHEFGPPDVLRLEDVPRPVPDDHQLLVRVRAASINPLDWHFMEGTPYIGRLVAFGFLAPQATRLGVDYAGTVEAIGSKVTQFKPGDEVFGGKSGACAEYICVLADRAVALKPANMTFEQAASVPIAAITALQALRDKGKVQPGEKVLINGASGGVGTFAVQIAKAFGADVTGVCSTKHAEMVRSIGADRVLDYTKEDFTRGDQRYDVIIDNVGNHSLSEFRRVLNPRGRYVGIGGGGINDSRWVGPLIRPIKTRLLSPFISQEMGFMLASLEPQDLGVLGDLMRAGKITPVIDRQYRLSEIREAVGYLEEGHARGKVVITMGDATDAAPVARGGAASPVNRLGAGLVASILIAVVAGVSIAPIVAAVALNRRFRRRHPAKRGYRWGYYFSILSFIGGLGLGMFLESGVVVALVFGAVYALLGWSFARRHRWAWIALTVLSLNPLAWIINAIYLRRRWSEDTGAPAAA